MAKARDIGIEGTWSKNRSEGEVYADADEVLVQKPEHTRRGMWTVEHTPMVIVGLERRPRTSGNTGIAHAIMTPAQARILARQLEREADKAERM